MKLKTAFEAAAAKFPERERRVALATFAGRYAHPSWPVTDYRCVGLDAEAIKLFLSGCGLDGAFEDVASSLDPDSHMIRWRDPAAAAGFAKALSRQLGSPAASAALYVAQLDRSLPAAGRLADEDDPDGDAPYWDPLGLVASTAKVAEAVVASGKAGKDALAWATAWLGAPPASRSVMAPLWVVEAARPDGRGVFHPSPVPGAFPASVGRYVRRNERLVPPFPAISSYPVANTWGSQRSHAFCPLDGYVQLTVDDLASVPPDPETVADDDRRDAWMHVESAYVDVRSPGRWDALLLAIRPKELWDYVVSLYEGAYGRRVVLVPGECLVHAGRLCDDRMVDFVSRYDAEAEDGRLLEVRPSVVFLDEGPDAAKPSGSELVAPEDRGLVLLPGEEPPKCERSDGRIDLVADAAAEWYAMAHASGSLFAPHPSMRPAPAACEDRVAAFRRWAKGAHAASDACVPDNVFLDTGYEFGYNGAVHAACGIVDDTVAHFGLSYIQPPSAASWKGANAGMHTAPKPVVAVYSSILGEGGAAPDLSAGRRLLPERVSEALDALADPEVQLSMPKKPKWAQVVVETNIAEPNGGFNASGKQKFLKDVFLWAFQANQPKDSSLTLTETSCRVGTHKRMLEEIASSAGGRWCHLWGASDVDPHLTVTGSSVPEYEGHIPPSNSYDSDDVTVHVQADAMGRLVFVLRVRLGSPADAVCRAAFRWFEGLPLVPNEGMDARARTLAKGMIRLDPDRPSSSATKVVSLHIATGAAGAVPGWTGMRTRSVVGFGTTYAVPERGMYELAATGATPFTAASLASRA